ncbi:MAG: response regulator transcription factor [Planctomycetota bacterium]
MAVRILIIDEDSQLYGLAVTGLSSNGYEFRWEPSLVHALQTACDLQPQLILLELSLQTADGLRLCQVLKQDPRLPRTDLMIVSSRTSELDQTLAFNMGADDFLTRPFSLPLLQQRIQMLLRARPQETSQARNGHSALELHGIEMNRTWRSVTMRGQLVDLTPTEFEILWTLLAQPGRPFTRSELLTCARGVNAVALERTIDVHVRALRQKIGDPGEVIETVRGIGYRVARKT